MAKATVRRCGYCREEKAGINMALGNICTRCAQDHKKPPDGTIFPPQVKDVLLCLDCRELKTHWAFAIPGVCQRCIIERLQQEPEELADEPATLTDNNKTIARRVTDAILKLLDQGKLPPWKMGFEYARPRNYLSMREYQGINRWLLLTAQSLNDWKDSRWLTMKQAAQAGGKVQDGATPTKIYFYLPGQWWVVKTHEVYNLEQTTVVPIQPLRLQPPVGFSPIAEANQIIESMPQRPKIQQLTAMTGPAHYTRSTDEIITPIPELYDTPERYYETMFHELAHSTGHWTRLSRFTKDQICIKNLHDRGVEELIAEMTAAMLCEKAGIGQQTIEMAAAYIQSWRDTIRADRDIVLQASHLAQQALEFIAPNAEN